jgi:phage head maturation protease
MTPKERENTLALMSAAAARQTSGRSSLRDWERFSGGDRAARLLALPAKPATYDESERTVTAVLSKGSPVRRPYGTEVLKISPEAVILTRVKTGGIPLLDSHSQSSIASSLGRVADAWVESGSLMGKIKFNATPEGVKAEGMVARSEITGISAGYRVEEWRITDKDGRVLDPEVDRIRFDDDLTFTATRWELLECSLVSVPADSAAAVRASDYDRAFVPAGIGHAAAAAAIERMRRRHANANALADMWARQQMVERRRNG